jgi:hypothetical protein
VTPSAESVATADPVGAEEWMYQQRANPDGSIPDTAIEAALTQSRQMSDVAMKSPSTDQVWKGLGPSNIGGRDDATTHQSGHSRRGDQRNQGFPVHGHACLQENGAPHAPRCAVTVTPGNPHFTG